MGTSVGVGLSLHKNPIEAAKEASLEALKRGAIEKPDFVFVFATVGYQQETLIRTIREVTAGAPLSGCSAEGVITRSTVAETNFGVVVMALASDELRFANVRVKEIDQGLETAGARLAQELRPQVAPDTIGCFLFADGLVFDFDPFRKALESGLGLDHWLPLFGGLSSDNWTSRRTYQYHDNEVFSHGMSCVLMSGKGNVAWGISHGCVPVGTKRTITRCKGNVIYEIDGIPALDALKEYMEGEWDETQWNKVSLNLCLGFKTPEHIRKDYGEYMVRYMMSKDDAQGSVTIQSDVEPGTEMWIVRRDKELIRDGLQTIAERIRKGVQDHKPKFVMHFECLGRGKVVFREQEKVELIRSLQEQVGRDVPWLGFYTYGEIGPIANYNCIHNFTAVVTAIY